MPIAPAAIAIIFNNDKTKILLVKRKDVPIWVLPGGGIDKNESAEDAVIREVLEETGYQVQINHKCAEYIPTNKLSAFTHLFCCEIEKGHPSLSCETADIAFFSLAKLPRELFFLHREWLQEALSKTTLIQKPVAITYYSVLLYFFKHPVIFIRYLITRCFKN